MKFINWYPLFIIVVILLLHHFYSLYINMGIFWKITKTELVRRLAFLALKEHHLQKEFLLKWIGLRSRIISWQTTIGLLSTLFTYAIFFLTNRLLGIFVRKKMMK